MNLNRLEYFMVVAKSGNLREAGEILRLSAPALSKAMHLLEQELDVQLWSKEGRALRLTDAGKALLKTAPQIIDAIQAVREGLHDSTACIKPTRIGTFEVFSTYFLKNILSSGAGNFERMELHDLLPGEIESAVAAGTLDFGITYMPVPNPELDFLKAASIEMGVFTRKGAFTGVSQEKLPFVTPVMPIQGVPTRVRGLDGWPEDAYRRKVLHQVTLMESALELCREGLVAGYFPAFVIQEHNRKILPEYQLERRKSPYPGRVCKSEVYIVKRKSSTESPSMRAVAKALRKVNLN
jgi:DNA-binding transcriptional LysR family regulator